MPGRFKANTKQHSTLGYSDAASRLQLCLITHGLPTACPNIDHIISDCFTNELLSQEEEKLPEFVTMYVR